MAKNKNRLDVPDLEVRPKEAFESKVKSKYKTKGAKNSGKKKFSLAKIFREMISELKKVDWAPFKKTKNNNGVIIQTSTVLIVVLFFLVFISLFDSGLIKLLEILLQSASPN